MHKAPPPKVLDVFRIDIRRVLDDPDSMMGALPGCVVVSIDLQITDAFIGNATAAQAEKFVIRLPLSSAALPLPDVERHALRSLADRLRSIADQLPALADAVPDLPPID